MSNGFEYYVVPKPQYLNTFVNNWFAEEIEKKFGRLPVTICPGDIKDFMRIVNEMHEDNRPQLLPLINLLNSGHSIKLDRSSFG